MSIRREAVLVTGASGYIGRLMVAALAGDDRAGAVIALDVQEVPESERLEGVRYRAADICDPRLADWLREDGVDAVVHLASIVRTPKGAPPDLAHRVDVEGTRNVLEACLAAGAQRLVVTSSGAAYGYHPDNPEWLRESDALRGNDDFEYSRNKRLVEAMLATWREEHPELEQVVLRPGTVLGDAVHSPITDLFEKPLLVGIAGARSPFVFIWDQDLVRCLLMGVFGEHTGIFNVAGDGAMTTREIARRIGKPYLPLPAPLLGAALAVLKTLRLTEHGPERVKFLRYRPVLANDALKNELGCVPEKTSAEAFDYYARSRGLL